MKFSFKAKNKEGELKEGVIDAANSDAAAAILQRNNLFPIKIAVEGETDSFSKAFLKYYDRVTDKELVVFFRQLAILIEARVPIVSSLSAINEQTGNHYFGKVIKEITNDIEDGMPFSDALSRHKDVFSNLSINVIRAGETSGNLKKSIDYVGENIEKNYLLMSRVRSAMIYPALVLVIFFLVGFATVSFILPQLTQVIKDLGVEVPVYTKIVIAIGDFMSQYWWAVAIIIVGFITATFYYIKSEDGRKEWDQIKIKLPVFGVLFRYIYITRFSQNLGILLVGGIPIIRALTVVSSVINNTVFEAIILKAADEVKVGGSISNVLSKHAIIPPVVSHMIRIGEESGQLDSVLGHIASFYEQETDIMTKNLSTLLEPLLMILIGLAVGFMAFAILVPIYNIATQIA